jgi:hypothetical protein
MDNLRSVLSYRRQWQKPDALLSPTLSSISLEILLCITDYPLQRQPWPSLFPARTSIVYLAPSNSRSWLLRPNTNSRC